MFNPPRELCSSQGRAATGSKIRRRNRVAVSRFLPACCTILRGSVNRPETPVQTCLCDDTTVSSKFQRRDTAKTMPRNNPMQNQASIRQDVSTTVACTNLCSAHQQRLTEEALHVVVRSLSSPAGRRHGETARGTGRDHPPQYHRGWQLRHCRQLAVHVASHSNTAVRPGAGATGTLHHGTEAQGSSAARRSLQLQPAKLPGGVGLDAGNRPRGDRHL